MGVTTVGWYQSVDPGGAFVALNAMNDPHVTVSGPDVLVPELSNLVAAYAEVDFTVAPQARISAPSLLETGFQEYLGYLNNIGTRNFPFVVHDRRSSPIPLKQVEALQFQVLSDPASATGQYGFVWLSDGAIAPVSGAIRRVRATASITLSAGTWVNGSLTFPVSLKAGRYQVVGMKAVGTGLIAVRLVFPGMAWRPGCIGVPDVKSISSPIFEAGEFGVLGEFVHSSPPTLDAVGASGSSQQIFLDVIYLG
jgi:hypothetical protein